MGNQDKDNQEVVRTALLAAQQTDKTTYSLSEHAATFTGRALMALYNGDFATAEHESAEAIARFSKATAVSDVALDSAEFWSKLTTAKLAPAGPLESYSRRAKGWFDHKKTMSLPIAIWAISTASDPKRDFAISMAALRAAIAQEAEHPLVPQAVAAFVDRIDNRADVD